MGSYLTVVNNTPDAWRCKVGADMEMLEMADIAILAIAGTALIVSTAGLAAPLVTAMAADGAVTVFGLSTASLVTVTTAAAAAETTASVIDGTTGFTLAVAKSVGLALDDKGFDLILAGQSHRYGKMPLSLWVQSTCVKTTLSGPTVQIDTLYMRPIFSGSTADSNRDHDIQYWIDKKGTKKDIIKGHSGPKTRALEEEDDTMEYTA